MTDAATRRTALRAVKTTQATLNKAEAKASEAADARNAAVLGAQQDGVTYAELIDATGLSESRVTQILRRERSAISPTD